MGWYYVDLHNIGHNPHIGTAPVSASPRTGAYSSFCGIVILSCLARFYSYQRDRRGLIPVPTARYFGDVAVVICAILFFVVAGLQYHLLWQRHKSAMQKDSPSGGATESERILLLKASSLPFASFFRELMRMWES
ncbi:hypothetical protein FN846DRAFT_925789, partial [Sphaerosporella brunnea]